MQDVREKKRSKKMTQRDFGLRIFLQIITLKCVIYNNAF